MSQEAYVDRTTSSRTFCTRLPQVSYEPALWSQMVRYLVSRQLDRLVATDNGWYPSTEAGDLVPRIVIPATSAEPHNRFWQARAMVEHPRRYESPHGVARGSAVGLVWPRHKVIPIAVVVEGPMCALAAAQAGCLGIALFGATPSREVLDFAAGIIQRRPVVFVLDADSPGAMTKVQREMVLRGVAGQLVSPAAGHKDLAEMAPEERRKLLCAGWG